MGKNANGSLLVMKNLISRVLGILIFAFSVSACGSPSSNLYFKHNSEQTGIFESDSTGMKYVMLGDTTVYYLKSSSSISIDEFEKLEIGGECYTNEVCIDFQLSKKGTTDYEKLTRKNLNKQIFYVIDGIIIASPVVAGVIEGGSGQLPIPKSMFDTFFVEK
ncbi:MAG: hypothetical protein EP338_07915 [Bacteroidetes bacterium]|nr:MAG: hypothetical protein EP338_07915 [Bacteroidota bacterium]